MSSVLNGALHNDTLGSVYSGYAVSKDSGYQMSGNKTDEWPVEVNLGKDSGVVHWESIHVAGEWVNSEATYWLGWPVELANMATGDAEVIKSLKEIASVLHDRIQNLKHMVEQARGGGISPLQLANRVEQQYLTRKLVASSSPLVHFIEELRVEDEELALHAIGFAISVEQPPNLPLALAGAVRVTLFQSGVSAASAEQAALESLHGKWESQFEKVKGKWDNEVKNARAKLKEMDEQRDRLEDEAGVQRSDHSEEMEKIRKLFRDELALRAASKYWKTKQTYHTDGAKTWGIVSGVVAAVGIATIVIMVIVLSNPAESIFKLVEQKLLKTEDAGMALTQAWFSAAMKIALVTALVVWVVRILVRNYLSHVHLATDAGERRVIIQTYLALINDPDVKGDDTFKKQILPSALENIFRHSPDGIVKDDAWTNPIVSLLQGQSSP